MLAKEIPFLVDSEVSRYLLGEEEVPKRQAKMALIPPFSTVVLKSDYNFHGLSLPAGATGVITEVLPHLKAYTVEFVSPHSCVETVAMWMVTPTHG